MNDFDDGRGKLPDTLRVKVAKGFRKILAEKASEHGVNSAEFVREALARMFREPQPAPIPVSTGVAEEEAIMKWCPQSMTTLCVGRKCMAWRWERTASHGYCGLAGKP